MIHNLKITGHHIAITPDIHTFVIGKLESLAKLLKEATGVIVHLVGQKKGGQAMSVKIRAYFKGKTIVIKQFITSEVENIYQAMAKANELLRQKVKAWLRSSKKFERVSVRDYVH